MTTIVHPHLQRSPVNTATRAEPLLQRSRQPRLLLGLILSAALGVAALEVVTIDSHSLISHTLSELFYAPGGQVLFPVVTVLLAGSVLVWARMLFGQAFRAAGIVAAIGGFSLLLAAIFPTDPTGTSVLSIAAHIHRYGAAGMFIAVPVAGLLATHAATSRAPPRTATSRAAFSRTRAPRTAGSNLVVTFAVLSALAAFPALGGRLESLASPGTWQDLMNTFSAVCGLVERIQLFLAIAIVVASAQALLQPNEQRKTAPLAVRKQQ